MTVAHSLHGNIDDKDDQIDERDHDYENVHLFENTGGFHNVERLI